MLHIADQRARDHFNNTKQFALAAFREGHANIFKSWCENIMMLSSYGCHDDRTNAVVVVSGTQDPLSLWVSFRFRSAWSKSLTDDKSGPSSAHVVAEALCRGNTKYDAVGVLRAHFNVFAEGELSFHGPRPRLKTLPPAMKADDYGYTHWDTGSVDVTGRHCGWLVHT